MFDEVDDDGNPVKKKGKKGQKGPNHDKPQEVVYAGFAGALGQKLAALGQQLLGELQVRPLPTLIVIIA